MGRLAWVTILGLAALLIGCSPASPGPSSVESSQPGPAAQRPLVMAIRLEPTSLSLRPPRETFSDVQHTAIFNADIAIADDRGAPVPYLVEALPQLNSDSWQVFSDGRMKTTYHLRPNLTWQDGTPLSAADFTFGYQVYATPEVGLALQPPFIAIEQVEATDAQTFVIHWKRPYPDAGHMTGRDQNFPALPRQLLEAPFASQTVESFLMHPYWSREFLGLGPYRVVNWDPGSFIEAAAFDGHATGRPKIDRIKIMFISDPNTTLANLLSGDLDFAAPFTLAIPNALTLKQEWAPKQGGVVLYQVGGFWHGLGVQFLPERTSPRALLDVRVRRALAHAIDRPTINDAINSGVGLEADYYLPTTGRWGPEVQRGSVKHGYDLQLSEQLMREAGFEKDADGIYSSSAEGQFNVEVRTAAGAAAAELAAISNNWENAGFKINQRIIPSALAQDLETTAGYPGLRLTTTPATERVAVSPIPGNIPTPENGWRGGSQISWTNPEYTRLVQQFSSTLDRDQRGEQMIQMVRVFSEDLAVISLHFQPVVLAAAAPLTGPLEGRPETNAFWNIHQWELR